MKDNNKVLPFEPDKDEFIRDTAEKVIAELSDEDIKLLLEHPDPAEHHFGLGLYI